ncbi:MAG: DUF1122 domain-containing protein [Xylanivirga thermophila]|jgi:hypothetical protein|uniref:hypothetical protein n=1 Tax=Xylanivirga thermophila TaxID=2496273 RepID=UPI0039F5AE48
MDKIYLDFDGYVPRYVSTTCINCSSVMGTSFCSIKDRGCCYYYPKFSLIEIQRMSKTLKGRKTLDIILKNPGTIVYHFYIHAKGFFDKQGYDRYMRDGGFCEVEDKTMFFRACPFVKSSYGCTLPPKYRTLVCNFFMCNELIGSRDAKNGIDRYLTERERYARWYKWENTNLEGILRERGLNLIDNIYGTLNLLAEIPEDIYEFPKLQPIYLDYSPHSRGA